MTAGEQAGAILPFLLVLLGPAPLAWAITARVERRGADLPRLALLALFSWCVLETALGLGLGAVGALRLRWLLVGEGLLFLIGLGLLRGAPRPQVTSERTRPFSSLVIALLAGVGGWLMWRAMVEPMTEGDSLAYHLPTIAQWYQTGRLAMMAQYALFSHYPYGWEILGALFVLPTGSDLLVALPNVLAWALFGLAIFCLAVEFGATREAGLGVSALALTVAEVMGNVGTFHVDLPFAAVVLTACYFGLRFLKSGRRGFLGLFLAAAGLLLGIKTSAITYLVALVLIGVVARRAVARAEEERSGNGLVVMGAAALLLIGGFWYVRNLVEVGSPLGPVRIDIGGVTLFPGQYDLAHFRRTTLLSVFDPGRRADWATLLAEGQGHFGLRFWMLLLLAAPAIPVLFRRRTAQARVGLLLLLTLAAATALLHAATPYSGDNGTHGWRVAEFIGQALRYALPFVGMLAALAAVTITAVGAPGGVALALGGVAAAAVLWRGGETGRVLLAAAAAGWALHYALRAAPTRRLAPAGAAAALALAVGLAPVAAARRESARKAAYGPAAEMVAQEVGRGAVGYLLSNRSYLLYDPELRQRVVYIPLTARDPEAWHQFLRRNHITLVAMGPVDPTPEERELVRWLVSPEGPLVPLTQGDPTAQMQVYRVKA